MFNFFGTILGYLQTFASFIINLVESLVLAVVALINSVQLPIVLIGYVPAIIGASISIVIALMVVKFLIGR